MQSPGPVTRPQRRAGQSRPGSPFPSRSKVPGRSCLVLVRSTLSRPCLRRRHIHNHNHNHENKEPNNHHHSTRSSLEALTLLAASDRTALRSLNIVRISRPRSSTVVADLIADRQSPFRQDKLLCCSLPSTTAFIHASASCLHSIYPSRQPSLSLSCRVPLSLLLLLLQSDGTPS